MAIIAGSWPEENPRLFIGRGRKCFVRIIAYEEKAILGRVQGPHSFLLRARYANE